MRHCPNSCLLISFYLSLLVSKILKNKHDGGTCKRFCDCKTCDKKQNYLYQHLKNFLRNIENGLLRKQLPNNIKGKQMITIIRYLKDTGHESTIMNMYMIVHVLLVQSQKESKCAFLLHSHVLKWVHEQGL